jgi:hypothetical protein
MSKSEEIINDWHEAKKLWMEKYPYSNLTMTEIVMSVMDELAENDKIIKKYEKIVHIVL